jgi:CheY-like chemotaxis protein
MLLHEIGPCLVFILFNQGVLFLLHCQKLDVNLVPLLIESVLNEVFRLDFNADIQISFDFRHSHKVNVDSIKIHRVFSNILGNAIQAMKLKGSLWFRTREVIENEIVFVEFCIGNNGSFIPEECIPMLFNAFYTSGKKGGTGLGLAIAQKVVNAHSGKIWCTSHADSNSPPGRVEFWFTLPASECASNDTKSQLPQHSSEVIAAFRALKEAARFQSQIYDASEDQFEREISSLLERLGRSVRIHFVDDEPVYRNALTAQIEKSKTIASFVHICKSNSAEIALKNVQDFGPADFYILDIDLGQSSMNGFELITEFKSRGYTGAICIHSNRCLPSDFKRAMDLGAQSYLPKPMTRSHLLKFILITLSELVIKKEEIPLKGTEF